MTNKPTPDDVVQQLRNPDRLRAVESTGLLTPNADASLDAVTALATKILELPTVYVSLLGEDVELVKSSSGDQPRVEAGQEIPLDHSLGKMFAAHGETLAVGDTSADPDFEDHDGCDTFDIGAFLGVPLKDGNDQVLGLLAAVDGDSRDWSEREIELMGTLGDFAATEIELAGEIARRKHLEKTLRQQSLYDSLTGLASRDLLADRLTHALERAERTGATLSVLYLDLDDFRDVNVALGREAGDDLLTQTADHLRSEARDQDSLGRLGRDEFALVLEDVGDRDQVAQIARRIHDTVATTVDLGESVVECRASIGYVLTNPDGEAHGIPAITDADRLLRMAEEAMHAAKKRGVPYVNAAEACLSG